MADVAGESDVDRPPVPNGPLPEPANPSVEPSEPALEPSNLIAEPIPPTPATSGQTSLVDRVMTREVLISIVFAILTFSVYWYLGPQDTAYSYQISEANNILHGHLDLRPDDSKNLSVLERVLFDGDHFCLPVGDEAKLPTLTPYVEMIKNGVPPEQAAAAIISPTCKLYMQHALGPSFVVMPGVVLFGKDMNQALVSVVMASLTAIIVYAVARAMTKNPFAQVALTVLMLFGTIFWWAAANGGVWMFAHTMATFFLFGAIYFTLVRRSPIMAGLLLGAAFMCRPTVLLSGFFFVVMFSDLWLKPKIDGQPLWRRLDLRPAMQFAIGIAPVLLFAAALNFIRYNSPTEFGYNYVESAHQVYLEALYNHGSFDLTYLARHPPVVLGQMPVFETTAPYVVPRYFGLAMWVTTPALGYIFFPNIKKYKALTAFGVSLLLIAATVAMSQAIAGAWGTAWSTTKIPLDIHFLPVWLMLAVAVGAAIKFRDKLVIACWAAIIPTAFVLFSFAFVGYSQFGYRYSLDFMPFLWLLVARQIGDNIKWHHWLLIGLSVAVNLWGILWIYQFAAHQTGGYEWILF